MDFVRLTVNNFTSSLRLQRHQEYLKMLAEREEALGESSAKPYAESEHPVSLGSLSPVGIRGWESFGEGVS